MKIQNLIDYSYILSYNDCYFFSSDCFYKYYDLKTNILKKGDLKYFYLKSLIKLYEN